MADVGVIEGATMKPESFYQMITVRPKTKSS